MNTLHRVSGRSFQTQNPETAKLHNKPPQKFKAQQGLFWQFKSYNSNKNSIYSQAETSVTRQTAPHSVTLYNLQNDTHPLETRDKYFQPKH